MGKAGIPVDPNDPMQGFVWLIALAPLVAIGGAVIIGATVVWFVLD